MKCKICKNKIENLNLSIFHDCKNTSPYIFDINEEMEYNCYNPFKNIHINKFFNQIEFDNKYNNDFTGLEYKAISIIESLLLNFFNYQFNNQTDKLLFHNSSPDVEIAERLKIIVKNLHNSNLEEKIEIAIKDFILDVYYLILARDYSNFGRYFENRMPSIYKSFPEIFTKKSKNKEKYKEEIIEYFHQYFKEKENIRKKFDKFIYIPNNTKIIDNLEQKYLLMKYNNSPFDKIYYNNVILYSIEKYKVLSSCYAKKIIKINNNKYIGLDKNKNLIDIEIKIDPDKNIFNLETSQCFKYIDIEEIIDFDIIDDYRLICIDKLNNIHLLLKKNYDYIIYKTINPKISIIKNELILNEKILIDKDNGQFAISIIIGKEEFLDIIEKNAILKFYDLELNLKKNMELEDLKNFGQNFESDSKEYNFPTIKKFNKELYIIFCKRIYLISIKYLEVISILNNIKYNLNCKYFLFPNSEEIFIKYHNNDEHYLYHYKLIKNELTLFKKYIFEEKLNELEEIDNKGNYSIYYQSYNLWQEYYVKNNKDENYPYPIFKEIKIKPISRRGKGIGKDMAKSKYQWGKNPKKNVRYFEKNNDNFYFEVALNPIKKKRRPKIEEEEGEENGENDEKKKEDEKEDIKRKEEKEFKPKKNKDAEELNKEDSNISLEDYLKTKDKPREEEEEKNIKRIEDDKILTKAEKEEENILSANGPGKKKGKKKKKNFKEVDDKIRTDFEIVGTYQKENKGRRQKGHRNRFVYNEEDFPTLK